MGWWRKRNCCSTKETRWNLVGRHRALFQHCSHRYRRSRRKENRQEWDETCPVGNLRVAFGQSTERIHRPRGTELERGEFSARCTGNGNYSVDRHRDEHFVGRPVETRESCVSTDIDVSFSTHKMARYTGVERISITFEKLSFGCRT